MADRMSLAEFEDLFEELKTWGAWGADDARGTLNYITPDHVVNAVRLVRAGIQVTLSLPVNTVAGPDNPRPVFHFMASGHDMDIGSGGLRFATDYIGFEFHGDCHSHMDALCHVSYNGDLYNGVPASTVRTNGATELSVDEYRHGIVGRGVLLDLPRLLDVKWLEPGQAVTYDMLEDAERAQGLRLRQGDIFLFRTGEHRRRLELGAWNPELEGRAGLHPTALRLLAERKVAAFVPDGDGETLPSPVEGVQNPIHPLQVTAMGLVAMDSMQFEDLVEICEAQDRWEFLFCAAPLRLTAGTGSPVNPIAVF